jgi:hypothetical protein
VKTFEYEPIEDYIEDLPVRPSFRPHQLPIVTPQHHTKWQRHEVVSTLVVRIIALSTSVFCASLVNFLVSGGAIDRIFKARYSGRTARTHHCTRCVRCSLTIPCVLCGHYTPRLYFTEKMIQKAFSSISVVRAQDPSKPTQQALSPALKSHIISKYGQEHAPAIIAR